MSKCNHKRETRKLLQKIYFDIFGKWFLTAALAGLALMGIQMLSYKLYIPVAVIFAIIIIGPMIQTWHLHHKICKRVKK